MITLSVSKEASPVIIFTHLKRTNVVVSGIDSKSLIDSWKVCPVVTEKISPFPLCGLASVGCFLLKVEEKFTQTGLTDWKIWV